MDEMDENSTKYSDSFKFSRSLLRCRKKNMESGKVQKANLFFQMERNITYLF